MVLIQLIADWKYTGEKAHDDGFHRISCSRLQKTLNE